MILAIWGDNKTGKSTMAMTFPKPLVVFDFDLGSQRALPLFHEEFKQGLIKINQYPMPLQFNLPRVEGARELWERFQQDYVDTLKDESIQTVVIDTATQLYAVVRMAYLEKLQDAQIAQDGEKVRLRIRLNQYEYAEPYHRLDTTIYAARSFGKHLVLTHYQTSEYEIKFTERGRESVPTGNYKLDGYKHTKGMVDILVEMRRERKKLPECYVSDSGEGIVLEEMTIKTPTYDKLMSIIEQARMIPL